MVERQSCCAPMIQNDVRDAFHAAVPGDSDCRQWQRLIDGCVHRNEAFDAAIDENARIRFKKLWVVTVSNGQVEEVLLPQVSFNAADDQRAVKITDFLGNHADHVCTFYTQVAGIEAGPVIQFASDREDSLLCVPGNRSGCSRFVQDSGTGPLREPHALGYHFQGYGRVLLPLPLLLLNIHRLSLLTLLQKWRLEWHQGPAGLSVSLLPHLSPAAQRTSMPFRV